MRDGRGPAEMSVLDTASGTRLGSVVWCAREGELVSLELEVSSAASAAWRAARDLTVRQVAKRRTRS